MITGLNHITLSCRNLEESFKFYKDTLKFKPLLKWERGAYFLAGDIWFCLSLDKSNCNSKLTSIRTNSHIAFSSTLDFLKEISELVNKGIIESWTNNTSEGDSIYILDPSGNQLEIHIGDWKSRVDSIKKNPYPGKIEYFE